MEGFILTIWEQSQVALWIMITIQTILLFVVLRQFKKKVNLDVGLPPGMSIPNLGFMVLNGSSGRLNDIIKGHPMTMFCVVEKGCKFCKELIPELDKMKKLNPNLNVKLLVMGDKEKTQELISITKTNLPVYIVSQTDVLKKLRIRVFPFGMLINQNGVILRREVLQKETISSFINALIPHEGEAV